jgi:hypothetical protein
MESRRQRKRRRCHASERPSTTATRGWRRFERAVTALWSFLELEVSRALETPKTPPS